VLEFIDSVFMKTLVFTLMKMSVFGWFSPKLTSINSSTCVYSNEQTNDREMTQLDCCDLNDDVWLRTQRTTAYRLSERSTGPFLTFYLLCGFSVVSEPGLIIEGKVC